MTIAMAYVIGGSGYGVIPEDDDFKLAVPELFHSGSLNKCLVKPQGT